MKRYSQIVLIINFLFRKRSFTKAFLVFILPLISYAQVDLKTRSERDTRKVVVEKIVKRKQSVPKAIYSNDKSEEIERYLEQASKIPGIWDLSRQFTVKSTTTLKGRLLNSVVSTNLESPVVVELIDGNSSLPIGTTFSCRGSTKHKRVFTACNRIVLPDTNGEEFNVQASILNVDGSAGIKADYYYTGKEEMIAGVVASAFIRGVVETSQDRVATPLGQLTPDNVKNRYLNGVLSTTDELTGMLSNEMKTREPKAYIESGKKVLIYFNERLEI